MNEQQKIAYQNMSLKQKAEYLLFQGVTAELTIDPNEMSPVWQAKSCGVAITPAGFHETKEEATYAAVKWLKTKAGITEDEAT